MQNIKASDHLATSAKKSIDNALGNARRQVVGARRPMATPVAAPTPSAPRQAPSTGA